MAEAGTITAAEARRAQRRLPRFPKIEAESKYGGQRGHMLAMVRTELNDLGFEDSQIDGEGLRITTTFTQRAMAAAERGVKEQRPEGFSDKNLHVAVASVEPKSGAVRGFFGGQDYLDSQINWAVTGGMVGSTFKPFAVAAGLKDGFSLKDTFDGNSPYYYNGRAPATGYATRAPGTTASAPTTAATSACCEPPRTPSTPPSRT